MSFLSSEKTPSRQPELYAPWPFRLVIAALGLAFSLVLLCLGATWRKQLRESRALENKLARGDKFIVAFWHGQYVPLFVLLRQLPGCAFSSDSFRGRVIQSMCRYLGVDCETLSSIHARAETQLLRATAHYPALALAVDGPMGPYHQVKPGVINLAAKTGQAVLPICGIGHHQWTLNKRWDKFAIPWFFTRVVLLLGDPLVVPSDGDPSTKQIFAEKLRNSLEQLEQRAQREATQ